MMKSLSVLLCVALLAACTSQPPRDVQGAPSLAAIPEVVEIAVVSKTHYRWQGKNWTAAQLQEALQKDLSFRPVSEVHILDTGEPVTIANILEVAQIAKAIGATAFTEHDGESKSIIFEE